MKYIKVLITAAVCGVVMTFVTTASAQDVKQGIVTVVRIQGEARYSSGDNVWHPLTVGKTLGANDVIETGANSMADLVLGENAARVGMQQTAGSRVGGAVNIAGLPVTPLNMGKQSGPQQNIIRLQADTVLAVDKFTFSQTGMDKISDTELDLRAGKIFGNVKKISAASTYIIKTPTGVAGIRGTTFYLGANGDVTVLEGSVVISVVGSDNQVTTITLGPGDSYSAQDRKVTNLSGDAFNQEVSGAQEITASVNDVFTPDNGTSIGSVTKVVVSPTAGHE